MSHEKSVTVRGKGGKDWVNLRSVVNKKDIGERGAAELYNKGWLRPLGGKSYKTLDEAVDAAKVRSKSFNRKHK